MGDDFKEGAHEGALGLDTDLLLRGGGCGGFLLTGCEEN